MDTKGTEPSVCITDMTVLQSSLLIQTLKRQSQVSTSQRCLYYSQTWYRHNIKGTELSVLVTALVPVLQSNLHNMDTKGQNYITEVSVLQSNLLNTDTKGHVQVSTWQRSLFYSQISWYRHQRDRFRQRCLYYSQTSLIWTRDRTKCPHHRGVCITIEPPDTDTNETELSVHITEESVLQLDLLIQTPKGQNQVSTSQRCLY